MNYTKEIEKYIETEKCVLDHIDKKDVNEVMNILENAREKGKHIFICGNGGSAATASHFCCDFNKGVSLEQEQKYNFECLNDNIPTMMAVANDIGYEEIFVVPLQNKMEEGDVVIGISGSGNSSNVLKAIEYANANGGITIGLVGYDGGALKKAARHAIHVNIDNMQIVEDVHMILDHVMMYVLSMADNRT